MSKSRDRQNADSKQVATLQRLRSLLPYLREAAVSGIGGNREFQSECLCCGEESSITADGLDLFVDHQADCELAQIISEIEAELEVASVLGEGEADR